MNNFQEFIDTTVKGLIDATQHATPLLLQGLQITILLSVVAIAIGIVLGFITCLGRISKYRVLRGFAHFYIWVVRGTPMIVQAFFIHFGITQVIAVFVPGFVFTVMQSAIITTSLNAGAYLAESFRGGIAAVPKGQAEAARSLGLSYGKTMRKVVLPQALKISTPAMVNQFIITIKDTSILSVIGLQDLTNVTKIYIGATFNTFAGWLYVGVYYLALISLLMFISQKLEAKMNYDRKN